MLSTVRIILPPGIGLMLSAVRIILPPGIGLMLSTTLLIYDGTPVFPQLPGQQPLLQLSGALAEPSGGGRGTLAQQ
eukprot:6921266-Pyramimonas_sp.AAC.1